ncbi:MAG: BolA family transcriptional regulator [Gammaproteobacteria bacterium]|nr:BolA family transcriptional regulator [Gammaproteobacteria bacterium]MCW8839797.1 BolA family transcriptional regulator [Gammaproteobacteria bacterium]MCW8958573.1 BolA family transcriptional regulator [Gammaproteobacteria bacterium]MCW8973927.1 BolA family transcriptional regulator [Gammaproteobacteria bacterium]MCW8993043.1 BolA family transcriptional regulator [Gammaproteobacteria bacterium]
MSDREQMIRERLETVFSPTLLEIIDESHKHAGHAGARGGGHFVAHIVSDAFTGKSTIQRHRMVFDAVAELMNTEIHALNIKAETTEENDA